MLEEEEAECDEDGQSFLSSYSGRRGGMCAADGEGPLARGEKFQQPAVRERQQPRATKGWRWASGYGKKAVP